MTPTPDGAQPGPHPDPDQRRVMETLGVALYEEAIQAGGLRPGDERFAPGSDARAALDLLLDLQLLIAAEPAPDRPARATDECLLVASEPSAAQAQIVTPLSRDGAELIAESAHWADTFRQMSTAWRRSPVADSGMFTELHGTEAITSYIRAITTDASEELLTAQPQALRGMHQLPEATQRDRATIERGVSMRTLYQHAARRNTATREYVRIVTEAGAQVRTLDEFFNRMIVVDRQVALIPTAETTQVAVAIRQPAIVAYLVDVFERSWERGRPFGSATASVKEDIANEQRSMTIRMLIEGHSDPASSKRLGVSARTYAGYIADLKDEYDAVTRFQLGYYMGQRGVTGIDDHHDRNGAGG